MSDVESTPPDAAPRQTPGWLTPVGVAAAVVALALASFGLGLTTGDQTVHMRPADMTSVMQGGSMPMMGGTNGMMNSTTCPFATTTTTP